MKIVHFSGQYEAHKNNTFINSENFSFEADCAYPNHFALKG